MCVYCQQICFGPCSNFFLYHFSVATRETASRSSRLFKKLHEARHHREKSEIRGNAQKGSTATNKQNVGDQTLSELPSGNEGPNLGSALGSTLRTFKVSEFLFHFFNMFRERERVRAPCIVFLTSKLMEELSSSRDRQLVSLP